MAGSFFYDIEYENGDDTQRAVRLSWHASFRLINISFYDAAENHPAFAEDFDLQTAIKLRDRLTRIIEAHKTILPQSRAGETGEEIQRLE